MSWPGSSAGCALPAKMNSTGRAGSPTIWRSQSRFSNSSVGALVGGEAAREADGEHVRVDRIGELQQAVEVRLAAVVAEVLLADAVAHQVQHLRLERLAHAPEHVVGNLVEPLPECAGR